MMVHIVLSFTILLILLHLYDVISGTAALWLVCVKVCNREVEHKEEKHDFMSQTGKKLIEHMRFVHA